MNLDFNNVDRICASVDLSVDKPVIDVSKVAFFHPFALIYLGMFLRYHNSKGKSFKVLVPAIHTAAHRYLTTLNFRERFKFKPDTQCLVRSSNCTSLNDIIDIQNKENVAEDIADGVLNLLHTNNVRQAGVITEVVSELVDNFAIHSKETFASLLIQYFPASHEVIIAIGDCGIGIRASLSSNPKHKYLESRNHHEAILKAFEPLVSRKTEGGTGLTMVRDCVIGSGGHLILASGDEYVRINKRETKYGSMGYDLSGVQVRIVFQEGS